jgi:hypothetical protein
VFGRALFITILLAATGTRAQEVIAPIERYEVLVETSSSPGTRQLRLTLAVVEASGWTAEAALAVAREGARILGQCGIALERVELVRIEAPARFRDFHSSDSRELARAVPLPRPAIYFVADTRQRPAFDAEAIGRGNSRSRPELADTVWITRGTRDPGIAIAHELAHVLMDSGAHSVAAGNLMREDTAPGNTRLSDTQCAQLRTTGSANGLLKAP